MARVTVEDCLQAVPNRLALVILTASRAKQLLGGSRLLLEKPRNKDVINALREIASKKVLIKDDLDQDLKQL